MATQQPSIPVNKYCNYMAQQCVQYTQDREKYSPNNVRRIVISPDVITVSFFVGSSIGKKLNPDTYKKCVLADNYASMVSVLGATGNRVCSHVEEIVFCTQGSDGTPLHSGEADWRKLINPTKSITTDDDFRKAISDRYKRLRAIIIYNGTFHTFNTTVKPKTSMGYLISEDTEAMGKLNFQVIDFHKTDWWKGRYFRPKDYPLDAEGTPLYKLIDSYMKAREEQEKQQQLRDFKEKRFAKFEDDFKKAYERLRKALMVYKKTILALKAKPCYMLNISGISITTAKLNSVSSEINDPFGIIDKATTQELSNSGVTVNTSKDISESAISESAKNMNSFCASMYMNLTSFLLGFLEYLEKNKYNSLKKECLSLLGDVGIFIPPPSRETAERLGIKVNVSFILSDMSALGTLLTNICTTEVATND